MKQNTRKLVSSFRIFSEMHPAVRKRIAVQMRDRKTRFGSKAVRRVHISEKLRMPTT